MMDHHNAQGPDLTLFDVFARIILQNAESVRLLKASKSPTQVVDHLGPEILDQLNGAFASVHIPIVITVSDGQTLTATKTTHSLSYPVNSMSDGEKSIFLLAGEVLTPPKSSLIVIDEPERHLHRSISSDVIEYLIATRSDTHFIVLTHDLDLAVALGEKELAATLCVLECHWQDEEAQSWTLHEVPNGEELPDSVRVSVLGGRSQVLFVEGASLSLDAALYKILFPDMVVTPAGSGEEVNQAVRGLANSKSHHWLDARGIVDGNERTPDERDRLFAKGILAIPASEIENLYYSEQVVSAVAKQQAQQLELELELDSDQLLTDVRTRGLELFRKANTAERLASKFAIAQLRMKILQEVPLAIDSKSGPIEIKVEHSFAEIRAELQGLIDTGRLYDLTLRVPVRDVGFPNVVARSLRFECASDFQARARSLLREDPILRGVVRRLVGELPPPAKPSDSEPIG